MTNKQTRSLALLGVITTEIVFVPLSWAALFYWLSKKFGWTMLVAVVAGFAGMIFGFIRVSKWVKKNENDA